MPRYKTGLSVSDFKKITENVRQYRIDLTDKCEEFARRMAEEGVEIAKLKIVGFDAILSGELLSSMDIEAGDTFVSGATYYIYTDCKWAPFVEFGTGVVGSESPHPDTSLANWDYDTNEHGESGWYYYYNGQWHWTKGMPSRPFMYETAKELRMKVVDIAREVFGDD